MEIWGVWLAKTDQKNDFGRSFRKRWRNNDKMSHLKVVFLNIFAVGDAENKWRRITEDEQFFVGAFLKITVYSRKTIKISCERGLIYNSAR